MRALDECQCLIVDVCGTLIGENTTRGYIASLPYRGWRRFARRVALSPLAGKIASYLDWDAPRALLLLSTRGMSHEDLAAWAQLYVDSVLARKGNPRVLELIGRFRGRHAPVYIASASLDYVVKVLAKTLGCSGYVASQLAVVRGRSTGCLAKDATGRKARLLQSLDPTVLATSCAVITDNAEDVDLIRHATAAVFIAAATQPAERIRRQFPHVEIWTAK